MKRANLGFPARGRIVRRGGRTAPAIDYYCYSRLTASAGTRWIWLALAFCVYARVDGCGCVCVCVRVCMRAVVL